MAGEASRSKITAEMEAGTSYMEADKSEPIKDELPNT